MNSIFKTSIIRALPILDGLLLPFITLATFLMIFVRRLGVFRFPLIQSLFKKFGFLPIRHHYYEPLFYEEDLKHGLDQIRDLPGICLNIPNQISLLKQMRFQLELQQLPLTLTDPKYADFYYQNRFFETGDAEMYYNFIRHFKPQRIIEVGSGWSTKIALLAIKQNQIEDQNYYCSLTCIEPFEHAELESQGVKVIREKVENLPYSFFNCLEENDILFIDSSHIIRPQGDVIYEIIQLLGQLKKGVLIQIHDIFTPRDYTHGMLLVSQYFWNEQYLLEAFLSYNPHFEIICSMNHLWNSYRESLIKTCPMLKHSGDPCSFWLRKVS